MSLAGCAWAEGTPAAASQSLLPPPSQGTSRNWPNATQPRPLLSAGSGQGSGAGAPDSALAFQPLRFQASASLLSSTHYAAPWGGRGVSRGRPRATVAGWVLWPGSPSLHLRTRKVAGAPPTKAQQAQAQEPRAGAGSDPSPLSARTPQLPLLLFALKGKLNTLTKQETWPHASRPALATATRHSLVPPPAASGAPLQKQAPSVLGTVVQSRGPQAWPPALTCPRVALDPCGGQCCMSCLSRPRGPSDQSHIHRSTSWTRPKHLSPDSQGN